MPDTDNSQASRLWGAVWTAMQAKEKEYQQAAERHVALGRVAEAQAALDNWAVAIAVESAAMDAARKELGIA